MLQRRKEDGLWTRRKEDAAEVWREVVAILAERVPEVKKVVGERVL